MSEPHQTDENEYSEPGADGLTFVIQNQSNNAIGTGGGGIAYEGIRNGIAVEYDLYSNDKNQIVDRFDPNGNHIALMIPTDSILSAFHYEANTKVMNKDILIMKSDGRKYYSKLEYKPLDRTFAVYLDSVNTFTQPVILINDFNLSDYISLAYNKGAYLGFTASCGSSYQRHKIHNWKFCNSLSAQPIISSVEEEIISSNYIFPNPASEYIEINLERWTPPSRWSPSEKIKIFNTFGECVMTVETGINVETLHPRSLRRIDISHLPIGVYYIWIGNYSEKFVVVR